MATNLLQDIDSMLNKYRNSGFSTAGGSDAVNSIGSAETADLIDAANNMRNKYSSQLDSYQSQLNAIPNKYQTLVDTVNKNISDTTAKYQAAADSLNQSLDKLPEKYQPEYDAHAVQQQTDLRRAMEQAANYGQLGGGALPQWQLQASASKQNSDNTTSTNEGNERTSYNTQLAANDRQKTSDLTSLQNQISEYNRQKQNDIDTITNQINSYNDQGESDLNSLISQYTNDYRSKVASQQSSAAAAAAQAAAEAQKLAAQQYEAELAAQARISAAQIAHSGGSSSGGGSSGGSSGGASGDTASVQQMLNAVGYNLSVDGISGPATRRAIADFQASHGLSADGIVGPQTLSALNDALDGAMSDARGNQTYTTRHDANGDYIIANVGGSGLPRKYSAS